MLVAALRRITGKFLLFKSILHPGSPR
jgi:hypothetical protein